MFKLLAWILIIVLLPELANAGVSSQTPIFIGEIHVDAELGFQAIVEKGNAKVIPDRAILIPNGKTFLVSFVPDSARSSFTGVMMLSRGLGDFDYYDYYQCEVFVVYNPKNNPAITITDPIPPCYISTDFSHAPIYKFILVTHRD